MFKVNRSTVVNFTIGYLTGLKYHFDSVKLVSHSNQPCLIIKAGYNTMVIQRTKAHQYLANTYKDSPVEHHASIGMTNYRTNSLARAIKAQAQSIGAIES